MARRTFSSLVKADSREPAITGGAKRKKSAFRLHEKHPSKSSRTRIYRTPIGRVDSSIRQRIKGSRRDAATKENSAASLGRGSLAAGRRSSGRSRQARRRRGHQTSV